MVHPTTVPTYPLVILHMSERHIRPPQSANVFLSWHTTFCTWKCCSWPFPPPLKKKKSLTWEIIIGELPIFRAPFLPPNPLLQSQAQLWSRALATAAPPCLPLPACPISQVSYRSSSPNLLIPSLQIQDTFPGKPQDALARGAGSLTADLHFTLRSSKFSHPVSPHLCSEPSAATSPSSLPPFPVDHRDCLPVHPGITAYGSNRQSLGKHQPSLQRSK